MTKGVDVGASGRAADRPNKLRAALRTGLALTLGTTLCFGTVTPVFADELDDRQAQLNSDIAAGQAWSQHLEGNLQDATLKLAASRQSLADARAVLARAESERDQAQQAADQRAEQLKAAEQQLATSAEQVASAQQAVDKQRRKAASDMRASHQQNTALLSVGMLVNNSSTADVSKRVQWAQTLYNANAAELNQLTNMQVELQKQQTSRAQLENDAHLAREDAQRLLGQAQQAQAAADAAAAAVDQQVQANAAVERDAQHAVEEQRQINAQMQADADDVARRINERNAERERLAEIERQRQAELARQEAERQRQAAQAAQQQRQQAAAPAAAPAPVSSGGILARPANGPYTSPYGYRVNPVLGYSELHDGLDIGAGCGTPIYAAESGVVAEVRYAGGWGNRAVIDHGVINGVPMSSGYNHAQGFIVSPGQWVSRGQQIGYIGTTGLSTGCHLHFHVWVNGNHTNPAPYL